MKSNFTVTVLLNTFKKLFTEKWQLAQWILIPVMIGGLFSLISESDGNAKPIGTLLVTDNDDSFLSQLFVGSFNQGPLAEMFIVKKVSGEQAKKIMDKGDASVWLEIEKDFTQNFIDEKPTTLKLVKNPSQNILPQIAETMVGTLADGGHYIQVLFSKELQQFNQLLTGANISDAQIALMSVQIKNTVDSIEQQLFPPMIKATKKVQKSKKKTTSKTFMILMFPGIMFMALLFSSQGMAQDFWKDKTQGIVNRLLSSPAGLHKYLNGKMMSAALVFVFIAVFVGLLGLFLFNIEVQKIFVIVLWLMISGVVLWSMMLFLSLSLPSEKSANLVTQGMVFPLMMLGGSFFPFEAMPKWMVMIGEKLPNGYLLQSFNSWFIKDNSLSVLTTPAIIALLFIVIMWFVNNAKLSNFARKK